MNWHQRVRDAGGVPSYFTKPGNLMHDGIHYHFSVRFDDDEAADSFLSRYHTEVSKSSREMVGGFLTLWFSVRN